MKKTMKKPYEEALQTNSCIRDYFISHYEEPLYEPINELDVIKTWSNSGPRGILDRSIL